MDLRCRNKKHGALTDDHLVEVKCDSRFCGAGAGVVVLHVFDPSNGELVRTVKYKNPERGESKHGSDDHSASVRHS